MKYLSIILTLAIVGVFVIPALAEVDVKQNGKKITTAVAIDFRGPGVSRVGSNAVIDLSTLAGNTSIEGDVDLTGALDIVGNVTGSGAVNWDGAILAQDYVWVGAVASDPCTTAGGLNWADMSIFFTDGGVPCFCKSGVGKKMYDGTTACY